MLYQKLFIDYISDIVQKKITPNKERASMFIVSKIKNKKAFLLQIIALSAFSGQCYGSQIYDGYKQINSTLKDNPILSAVVCGVLAAAVTHVTDNYLKNPEMTELDKQEKIVKLELDNLNKQEKIIDLELKNDPEYVKIGLLKKHNKVIKQQNQNEEERQRLVLQNLERRLHVEEKISEYRECATTGATQEERDDCQRIYENYLKSYISYFPTE